ncbi:MAG: efflux RND transporter permease subunit [Rhodocyclaceae bacterium]|nr:efflux RND transporter permease subunit [Rhodocyclaceae bacterium]
MHGNYVLLLSYLLTRRRRVMAGFLAFCLLSCGLFGLLGRDLFPNVDTGQLKLHLRAPTGTRIARTALIVDEVEAAIRDIIPPEQLDTLLDNIGLPYSGINLSYSNSGTIGTLDADILISLKPGHGPSAEHVENLARELRQRFPGLEFFFQPADIVTQILNFGIPAAIDLQISGSAYADNLQLAGKLLARLNAVPGAADVRIHQRLDGPTLQLQMDRTRLQSVGISPADLGQNLLLPLSGSAQTTPTQWLNPANRVIYTLAAQTPQYKIGSLDELLRHPVQSAANAARADCRRSAPTVGRISRRRNPPYGAVNLGARSLVACRVDRA